MSSSCHYVASTGSYYPPGCQKWTNGGSSNNYGSDGRGSGYTGYGGSSSYHGNDYGYNGGSGYKYGGNSYHGGYNGGSGYNYGGNSYHGGGSQQKASGEVTVVVKSYGQEKTYEIPLADLHKATLYDVKYNLTDDQYVYIPEDYTWKDWQHKPLFPDGNDLTQEELDKMVGAGDWYFLEF